MEEGSGVDDVEGALQGREGGGIGVGGEDVAGEEVGVEGGAVAEEVVAESEEVGLEVGAVEVGGGHAGGDEGAEVLAEAAAEVEEEVGALRVGGGEEREEGWVQGVLGDGEVEEAELADAGVGRYAPGAVADGEDVSDDFVGRDVAVGFQESTCRFADGGDVFFEPRDICARGLGSLSSSFFVVGSHG